MTRAAERSTLGAALVLLLGGCAAPWNSNQVTPCLLQCAVTITGPAVPVATSTVPVVTETTVKKL